MALRKTAARRYADAALELGKADGTLEAWERDLGLIREAFRQRPLLELVEHPAVPFAEKEKVLRRALDGIGQQPMSLVLLMVRRGRPGAVEPMVARFEELLRREHGIELAEVRTAMPLDDQQRRAVTDRLGELTGSSIEIRETVDESLIGGISVRIGDRLWDASVRSRLERLRARLTAV